MIVIDASAALYLAASRDGFSHLRDHDPIAPPLMWSEALSVLHESQWRGEITDQLAVLARNELLHSPIKRYSPDELHLNAWHVADELGWAKLYDAEYVALAKLLACRLLTVDERLRSGVRHLVQIIGPTEL